MTHYCVLGNQPRMKADPDSSADQIHFQFAGGSNLDPAKDKHMHEATLTIIDADHIELKGVGWEGGARQGDVLRPEIHPQEGQGSSGQRPRKSADEAVGLRLGA